ncbi:fructosamine kinase family protein [Lacticaseibacillus jixiensis]|uniref:fructosamine kinase family protein n=1 Tax=Lacticaseibacillus jixiensis TaxID=3231926 RepID=UPI0036F33B48
MSLSAKWLARLPLAEIRAVVPVGGGDVNQAYRLSAADGEYFLLVQPQQPANFYAGEIAGLEAFAQAQITAPRVIAHGQIYGDAYLLLNYLAQGSGKQSDLGALVAKLHSYQSPSRRFGFSQLYAGTSVSFANPWSTSWRELFVNQRLDVLDAALRTKHLWGGMRPAFLAARAKIVAALGQRHSQPVLLHGDLWSGNYMFLADGRPALIDPAAWYGDREFDIGITTVFGGFDADFYASYQAHLPLDAGYQKRLAFYRLYYLMVHLDKFGATYANMVQHELTAILE